MDEELKLAAMEQMMGLPGTVPAGGDMGMATEAAPPGYTMVYVPDSVLPAVMELVAMSESGGAMGAPGDMGMGAPVDMGMAAPPMM